MTKFIACWLMTLISALVSLGFSLAAVRTQEDPARTVALYASARSLAFAVISLPPILTGSVAWEQAAATGMVLVQVGDAAVGLRAWDRLKTFGPAATALANLAALLWLSA